MEQSTGDLTAAIATLQATVAAQSVRQQQLTNQLQEVQQSADSRFREIQSLLERLAAQSGGSGNGGGQGNGSGGNGTGSGNTGGRQRQRQRRTWHWRQWQWQRQQ